jgi:DNA-binding transcriptional LysR family regulator
MIDLNDLRVFEKVALLHSFSRAAKVLGLPKSSVSRSIARLESDLGVRLMQRTTRGVRTTELGEMLRARCADILDRVDGALDSISDLSSEPRGSLRISAGIGFGANVLSGILPEFLERYPHIDLELSLTPDLVDMVADEVDMAIRMGPLPDAGFIAVRLGTISRYLCAAPRHLKRRGTPDDVKALYDHDIIEMLDVNGRIRSWMFSNRSGATFSFEKQPRLAVNDPATIHRLVLNGAGFGCLSSYLCAPDVKAGRLVHCFPEWTLPAVEVNAVFPSRRALSPSVRALIDFLKSDPDPGRSWASDPMTS